jgi:hypothetical protein
MSCSASCPQSCVMAFYLERWLVASGPLGKVRAAGCAAVAQSQLSSTGDHALRCAGTTSMQRQRARKICAGTSILGQALKSAGTMTRPATGCNASMLCGGRTATTSLMKARGCGCPK